jgi:UPF0176 protein
LFCLDENHEKFRSKIAMFTVAALYRFVSFDQPADLREPLLAICNESGVKGTLLLAREGINGTIAGSEAGIARVVEHIRSLPDCANMTIKYATAETMPFLRMKVRLKKEIVTLGVSGIDPARHAGTYVKPDAWNALIADPETILIDTRNAYEVKIGTFEGAIDPKTESFSDFPAWFEGFRETIPEGAKIAMFCTGGIRCEKSTAYLKSVGVEEVFHLEGGILKYLETVPEPESRWQGECFVFDQRVSVGHGLVQGEHVECHGCRMPLNRDEQASPDYAAGVQCHYCVTNKSDDQRDRYAERQRQVELAERRGVIHLGRDKAEESM